VAAATGRPMFSLDLIVADEPSACVMPILSLENDNLAGINEPAWQPY
jgi:hypothetical protein